MTRRALELVAHVAIDRTRRARRAGAIGVLAVIATSFLAVPALSWLGWRGGALEAAMLLGGLASLATMLLWRERSWRARFEAARLVVDDSGVIVETALRRGRWSRAELTDGWLEADGGLRLWRRDGDGLVMASLPEGAGPRVLSRLGLDPGAHAATLRTASASDAAAPGTNVGTAWGAALLPIVPFLLLPANAEGPVFPSGPTSYALAGLGSLLVALVLLRYRAPRDVVVGTDGVVVRGTWRRRYVPFEAIVAVDLEPRLTIATRHGTVPLGPLVPTTADRRRDAALLHRIATAMQERERSQARRGEAMDLALGDRDVARWREALRSRAQGAVATYRRDTWTPEDLAEIALDPSQAPDVRIGAAVAAAGAGDDEVRRRLRVAADACAHQDLRAALEVAAEGEVEEAAVRRLKLLARSNHSL